MANLKEMLLSKKIIYGIMLLSAVGLRFVIISSLLEGQSSLNIIFNYSALLTSLWPYITLGLTFVFSARLPVMLHNRDNSKIREKELFLKLYKFIMLFVFILFVVFCLCYFITFDLQATWLLIFIANVGISNNHLFTRSLDLNYSSFGYLMEAVVLILVLLSFFLSSSLSIYAYCIGLSVVVTLQFILVYKLWPKPRIYVQLSFFYVKNIIKESSLRILYNLNVYFKDNFDLLLLSLLIIIDPKYSLYYKYLFYSSIAKILISIYISTTSIEIGKNGPQDLWKPFFERLYGKKTLLLLLISLGALALITWAISSISNDSLYWIVLIRIVGLFAGVPMMLYISSIIQLETGSLTEVRGILIPQIVAIVLLTGIVFLLYDKSYIFFILSLMPLIVSSCQLNLLRGLRK